MKEELKLNIPGFNQKELTFATGEKSPRHFHKHTHETYVVTRGKGRITVGAKTHEVTPGSFVDVAIHAPHQVFNDGPDELVLISTKDKPADFEDFFEC